MKKRLNYKSNPDLELLKAGYEGNVSVDGRFSNDGTLDFIPFTRVLRWQLTRNPQRAEKKSEKFQLPVQQGNDFVNSREDMIVWLGHSSFLIRTGGVTFLTDPCLTNPPLVKRHVELPCPISDLTNIDHLLISHGHLDHFDITSLKIIIRSNPDLSALIPLGMSPLLNSCGAVESQEAGWYQRYTITSGEVTVVFLPAMHWYRRTLADFNRVLWGSFLIKTPKRSIYFAGDTGYSAHFQEIRDEFGPIDICLMPIGAYKPSYIMQRAHTSPQEAYRGYRELGGGRFIPMHYGTFDLADEPMGEPIRIIRDLFTGTPDELKELVVGKPLAI